MICFYYIEFYFFLLFCLCNSLIIIVQIRAFYVVCGGVNCICKKYYFDTLVANNGGNEDTEYYSRSYISLNGTTFSKDIRFQPEK
jgi:hypothetical protein